MVGIAQVLLTLITLAGLLWVLVLMVLGWLQFPSIETPMWGPLPWPFVLLVGGAHAEGYSLGYLVQMAVGVVVGLLVNFLVFPPLHFWDAEHRIDAVNEVLADHRRAGQSVVIPPSTRKIAPVA